MVTGERSGSKEVMADAEAGVAEAEDVTLVESITPSTKATPGPSATGLGIAWEASNEPNH
jgi:hypothetical protein